MLCVIDSTYLQDPSSFWTQHPELVPLPPLQSRSIDLKVGLAILRKNNDVNVRGVEKFSVTATEHILLEASVKWSLILSIVHRSAPSE